MSAWQDYLEARYRLIWQWAVQEKRPDEAICFYLCMDPGQVQLLTMKAREEKEEPLGPTRQAFAEAAEIVEDIISRVVPGCGLAQTVGILKGIKDKLEARAKGE